VWKVLDFLVGGAQQLGHGLARHQLAGIGAG
jgi:hypothetical protein